MKRYIIIAAIFLLSCSIGRFLPSSIADVVTRKIAIPSVPAGRFNGRTKEYKLKGQLYVHNDAVLAAAADLSLFIKLQPPEVLPYIRYLTVHNIPLDFRKTYYETTSLLLNSLCGLGLADKISSFNKIFVFPTNNITRPAWGGPENILIRVNLLDYGIDPAAWDRLGVKDPYFHQFIFRTIVTTRTNDWDGWYLASDGYYYYKSNVTTSKPVKKLAQAAWLNTDAISYLVDKLQTEVPILRADWFIKNASIEPAYSDLLGIKTIDDYKRLAGFDERAEKAKEIKATVVKSGSDGLCPRVAFNNRILARTPTFNGYFWQTVDFKTSIGLQNVILQVADLINNKKLNQRKDAAEFIATLPNGLQFYALTNGNDELVPAGDSNIVGDSMSYDFVVRNGRSCISCHSAGLNQFKSQFQKQIGYRLDQSDLGVFDKDPTKALAIQYKLKTVLGLADFDLVVAKDNEIFAAAVSAANGLDPYTNGSQFRRLYEAYDFELIDKEHLVFEIGLPWSDIETMLSMRLNGVSNGVLIQALLKPPLALRRDQFEESFSDIGLLSQIIKPANKPPQVMKNEITSQR